MHYRTYWNSLWSAQLSFQTIRECPWYSWLVWVHHVHDTAQSEYRGHEGTEQNSAPTRLEVGVLLWGEHTQDIVILVDRLAVVASLLLVPPVAVRITELALHRGRVDIAAVLHLR